MYKITLENVPIFIAQQKKIRIVKYGSRYIPQMYYTREQAYKRAILHGKINDARICLGTKHYTTNKQEDNLEVWIDYYICTRNKKLDQTYKITRPDLDNMTKIVLDELQENYIIYNDSNIVKLHLLKCYKYSPYCNARSMDIVIRLKNLDEQNLSKL